MKLTGKKVVLLALTTLFLYCPIMAMKKGEKATKSKFLLQEIPEAETCYISWGCNGKYLAVNTFKDETDDFVTKIISTATGETVNTLEEEMEFVPNKDYMYSGSPVATMRKFDCKTATLVQDAKPITVSEVELYNFSPVNRYDFSPDGKYFSVYDLKDDTNKYFQVNYKTKKVKEIKVNIPSKEYSKDTTSLSVLYMPNDRYAIKQLVNNTKSNDSLEIINVKHQKYLPNTIPLGKNYLIKSFKNKIIIAEESEEEAIWNIKIVTIKNNKFKIYKLMETKPINNVWYKLEISPLGNFAALSGYKTFQVIDITQNKKAPIIKAPNGIKQILFSPDETLIATVNPGGVKIWKNPLKPKDIDQPERVSFTQEQEDPREIFKTPRRKGKRKKTPKKDIRKIIKLGPGEKEIKAFPSLF